MIVNISVQDKRNNKPVITIIDCGRRFNPNLPNNEMGKNRIIPVIIAMATNAGVTFLNPSKTFSTILSKDILLNHLTSSKIFLH